MPGWSRNRRPDLDIEMAGTSGKPVTQKPGIQPGFCIFIDGAPAAYGDIVGELPADASVTSRLKGARRWSGA
jgi:hypothetical protein